MNKRKLNQSNSGFTLIEIFVVLGVISVLVGVAISMFSGNIEESKITKARVDIKVILDAVLRYRHEHPNDPFYTVEKLKGRYLLTVPVDPWSKEYIFDPLDGHIQSAGPDGLYDTGDDITEIYPNPRIKIALFKSSPDFEDVFHIVFKGSLAAPRAGLANWNGLVNPVAVVSGYKNKYSFYLNYPVANPDVIVSRHRNKTVLPIGTCHVSELTATRSSSFDENGFLDISNFGEFSQSLILFPRNRAAQGCNFLEMMNSKYRATVRKKGFWSRIETYHISVLDAFPALYYYEQGQGAVGIAFLCEDRRDIDHSIELDFEYWRFDGIEDWTSAVPGYLVSGSDWKKHRFEYNAPPNSAVEGDFKFVSGTWRCSDIVRVW